MAEKAKEKEKEGSEMVKASADELAEDAPVSKMTRAEFVARLGQLIAEGEASELPTTQIIASRYAREGTRRITSIVDDFLDGLAGSP